MKLKVLKLQSLDKGHWRAETQLCFWSCSGLEEGKEREEQVLTESVLLLEYLAPSGPAGIWSWFFLSSSAFLWRIHFLTSLLLISLDLNECVAFYKLLINPRLITKKKKKKKKRPASTSSFPCNGAYSPSSWPDSIWNNLGGPRASSVHKPRRHSHILCPGKPGGSKLIQAQQHLSFTLASPGLALCVPDRSQTWVHWTCLAAEDW